MTSNTKIIANAVCGKTARPCDCCIKKRARWYCTADDAFLCQGCDGSVHSANPLAWRHERVRLKTASLTRVDHNHNRVNLPSWHWGLTRKTRTPRHAKHFVSGKNPAFLMVPELGGEDTTSSSNDCETEDGVLHRVPILDPFEPELSMGLVKEVIKSSQEGSYQASDLDDLKEFAADVETLLGKGLDIDAESYGIADLRFFEYNENTDEEKMQDFRGVVKEENELANAGEIIKAESDHVAIREPFDLSFVYEENFPTTCELGEGQKVGGREEDGVCKFEEEKKEEVVERKKISLRLDYGAISDAWACQGSPWMNGQRPLINLDDSWPHCLLGALGGETRHQLYGEYQIGGMLLGGQGAMGNGGREARVSRYREKRRTRLFSKKIRYEVRKLNAQKRPRMKGRFVKRSCFPPTSTSFHLLSK